jgi:hypothetical protein
MDIKDQTEANQLSWWILDNPFWTVNKNSALSDSQRYIMSVNLAYDLAPWMKINYRLGNDNLVDNRKFSEIKIVEVLQMGLSFDDVSRN